MENDAEKQRVSAELAMMQDKIENLKTMCDKLPPQVQVCESNVLSVETKCEQLLHKVDQTIKNSVEINASKWNVKDQEKFMAQVSDHFKTLEDDIDKNADHTDSLQNWIDIYMPMRLQHQITETIKDCLPRKGRYLLGVVDQQMQNQLRERMFADVNYPGLK